jgi:Ca2+-binding RTX toxin-like protein
MSTLAKSSSFTFNGSTSFSIGGDVFNWSNRFILAIDIYAPSSSALKTATVSLAGSDWAIGTLRFVENVKAVINDSATGDSRSINNLFLDSPSGHDVTLVKTEVEAVVGGSGVEKFTSSSDYVGTVSLKGGNDIVSIKAGGVYYLNLGNGDNQLTVSGGYVGATVAYGGNDKVTFTAGDAETINLGGGNNVLKTTGGYVHTVISYGGNDTISIGAGGAEAILAGSGNNTISTSSGEVTSIVTHSGKDIINLGSGGAATVSTGSGDDSVNLTPLEIDDTVVALNGRSGVDTISFAKFTSDVEVALNSGALIDTSNGFFWIRSFENVTGGSGNDTLTGDDKANVIKGGSGNDSLNGWFGLDVLTGGAGSDHFVFNRALSSANVDTITDFDVNSDTISLENSVFTALATAGTLSASGFNKNLTGLAADSSDRVIYETDTGKLYYDQDGSGSAFSGVHFATLSPNLSLTNGDFLVI